MVMRPVIGPVPRCAAERTLAHSGGTKRKSHLLGTTSSAATREADFIINIFFPSWTQVNAH